MTPGPCNSKLIDPEALEITIRGNPEKKFVLAGGTFDILKPSHIDLIEFASDLGDVLIIAVTEEGTHTPLAERLEILNEVERIDYLFTFSGRFSDDRLLKRCHRIVSGDEFQPVDTANRYSENQVDFPGLTFHRHRGKI